jgi:hypothetical protein
MTPGVPHPRDLRADVRLDLLDGLHVDQWVDHGPRFEPVGDLRGTGGLGEPLGKGIVDPVLHQDAAGADAGLAGIAVFGRDRPLDRHLDVGVVEDDERRFATEKPWCRLGLSSALRNDRSRARRLQGVIQPG